MSRTRAAAVNKTNITYKSIKHTPNHTHRTTLMEKTGALSGTSWGSSSRDLRVTRLAYVQSKLTYASAAWLPLLSESKLQTIQNRASRIITEVSCCTNAAQALLLIIKLGQIIFATYGVCYFKLM